MSLEKDLWDFFSFIQLMFVVKKINFLLFKYTKVYVSNQGIIINFWWMSSFFLNQSFHEVLLISYPNQSEIKK